MTQPPPRRRRLALVHAAVIATGLVPFAVLAGRAAFDALGANPIEEITHETGDWALRFLLLALAITPLRLLFGWRKIAPYRRTFGLLAFFYASLHFGTYVGLDLFFEWDAIAEDVLKRPYVTAGFTAFLCLLPLAITSTRAWVRRLGRRWIRLHRLAYVAGVAAIVHFLWLVKADLREPLIYASILASLLAVRVWDVARRRARTARVRAAKSASARTAEEVDDEPPFDEDEAFRVPIEQAIDLHTFAPRDIPRVVEAYLEEAVAAGFREVRLIHGKGKGVQRDRVQGVLAQSPLVARYEDAPPQRGGWGATLAWLNTRASGSGS